MLKDIKDANQLVDYQLGYSNLTFDLWICLHKKNITVSRGHRKEYVHDVNSAFNKKYSNIDEYKREKEFKAILSTITLDDVKAAIERAKIIRLNNQIGLSNISNQRKTTYCGFEYYCENPDLNIQEIVEKIINDCIK